MNRDAKKVQKQKFEGKSTSTHVADTVLGSASVINGINGVMYGGAMLAGAGALKGTAHHGSVGAVRAIGAATAAFGAANLYSGHRTFTRKD